MVIIGLTGSIGMGKSTVSDMMRRMGCPVHDADKVARSVLRPDGAAYESVALAFPSVWNKKKRILDKDKLRALVFEDAGARQRLESIIHPYVRMAQKKFIYQAGRMNRKLCALDIPLLFETGAEQRVDATLLVTAPYFVQRQRVMARKGMSEELFEQILNAQMPDLEKRRRADYILQTGLGKAHTFSHLKEIMKELAK